MANGSFNMLKLAITSMSLLKLADFYKKFIIETDASGFTILEQC